MPNPFPLTGTPQLTPSERARISEDAERFGAALPTHIESRIESRYGLQLRAQYGGEPIRNPFGKASGQLSLNVRQVARDAEAGLGFVVLKTVIAVDAAGGQAMAAWAIPETRMRVEPITTPDGTSSWTVTWKGRGWSDSFEAYCRFFDEGLAATATGQALVVPSVKYHLPGPGEAEFRTDEYEFTTARLQDVWHRHRTERMPLEKDFSPTLAGDARSDERAQVLLWLRRVPDLIRNGGGPRGIRVGIKLMNTRFDDAFQVEMLRAIVSGPRVPPDYLVYANRLFDPAREFEGTVGVAYGGPELSGRNLRCMALALRLQAAGELPSLPPISATGDILTGRRAAEYALLGATSCQMHTLFQLPDQQFIGRAQSKSATVLHHLLFHPETGLLAWMLHLRRVYGRPELHWLDLPALGRELVA